MQDLSLHLLDIVENSIEAQASRVEIQIEENRTQDLLVLEVVDNGRGMDEEMVKKATDPFVTTKLTRRVGLGLPLLAEAARQANGHLEIQSTLGQGTRVRATFQLSHIDLKPLGDITQTLLTLIVGHPEVHLVYTHRVDGAAFRLDTAEIKAQLDGIPIQAIEVLKILKNHIKKGLTKLRRQNGPRKSV